MVVDIYSPNGAYLTSLGSPCNAGAALGLTLTNTGTYTFVVHESYYRATSGYQLNIQTVTGGGCNGKPITCGETVTASTTFYTQMDTYRFSGTAGQALSLALWGPIACDYDRSE